MQELKHHTVNNFASSLLMEELKNTKKILGILTNCISLATSEFEIKRCKKCKKVQD